MPATTAPPEPAAPTAKHFDLPWIQNSSDIETADAESISCYSHGFYPLEVDEANAEFICRVANSHAQLVEALREYVKAQGRMLERWADADDAAKVVLWNNLHACEDAGRAALALAGQR